MSRRKRRQNAAPPAGAAPAGSAAAPGGAPAGADDAGAAGVAHDASQGPAGGGAAPEAGSAAPPSSLPTAGSHGPAHAAPSNAAPVTPEALAVHLQALEGVRRLHLDLAERLSAGEALHGRVDRLGDGLEQVRAEQDRLRRELERPAGRRMAVLAVAILLGAVGGVWAWERLVEAVPGLAAWRREVAVADLGGADRGAADRPASRPATDPRAAALASSPYEGYGWTAGDAPDARVADGDAAGDRDGAPRDGSAAGALPGTSPSDDGSTADPALAAEVDALRTRAEKAESLLASARSERNRQLGENTRLRQELIEKQLRLDELVDTVEEVAADADRRRVEPVSVSRSSERAPPPDVAALNAALAGAGVAHLQVVEVGGAHDGALLDLIVLERDLATGAADVRPVPRAHLTLRDGVVHLVLRSAGKDADPTPVELSPWTPSAWEGTGLALPSGFVPVGDVASALRRLLGHHPYEVVSLGGVADGELLDLVLDHVTPEGDVLRTFHAGRAVVQAEGPELVLTEGTVTEGDDERPFWRGQSRLPLPGSDYAAWRETIDGRGP